MSAIIGGREAALAGLREVDRKVFTTAALLLTDHLTSDTDPAFPDPGMQMAYEHRMRNLIQSLETRGAE
jgi:hypothetical protein